MNELECYHWWRGWREIGLEYQPPHFAASDSLRVRGALDKLLALAASDGLEIHRPEDRKKLDAATLSDSSSEAEAYNSESAEKPMESEAVRSESASPLRLAEVVVLRRRSNNAIIYC